MAARKYAFKSAQEIINQKQSYVANINMVWDAATEAAEELTKAPNNARDEILLCGSYDLQCKHRTLACLKVGDCSSQRKTSPVA